MRIEISLIPGMMVGIEFPANMSIIVLDLFIVRMLFDWGNEDDEE